MYAYDFNCFVGYKLYEGSYFDVIEAMKDKSLL